MKQEKNIFFRFLLLMGITMLYLTVVYIVPKELDIYFSEGKIIAFSTAYIPLACWYFNDTLKK